MTKSKVAFSIAAVMLTIAIVLAGIRLNAMYPVLQNNGTIDASKLKYGVALTGWQNTSANEWQFTFTPDADAGTLVLCIANSTALADTDNLACLDNSGELYEITSTDNSAFTITVQTNRKPQAWLVPKSCIFTWMQMRTILQIMALTIFATMAATVMALFCYKHQWELGCFLLYLLVLCCWGILVYMFPAWHSDMLQLMLRGFFSFAVLAPIWLCLALTNRTTPQANRPVAFISTCSFILLTCLPIAWLRTLLLVAGMCYCIYVLLKAFNNGSGSALVLLVTCAITTGLRVWVLMPSLGLSFFAESFLFYVIRCARIYDVPFAFGCMIFVCRRFALQFDRTEQLALELDKRVTERTQALTEETEARKSMMLNIFHDLRSPLFAVSSGLDTIAQNPQALQDLLPALQQRIRFVHSLTEDLFLAAKLEQKQIMLNEDNVFLNEIAASVCIACQSEANQKGVLLAADTNTVLPVWGDSTRLQQIIQNIVTNAIHYTPCGGQITVTCTLNNSNALVSVQDTGCGIAPADQSAVFDRYFHTTANTKHDSTGLGLTIAQELAHLHHGEITLQSEVGKGSCFTLVLPLLE